MHMLTAELRKAAESDDKRFLTVKQHLSSHKPRLHGDTRWYVYSHLDLGQQTIFSL